MGVLRECLGSCKDPPRNFLYKIAGGQKGVPCYADKIHTPSDLIQRGICKAPLRNPRVRYRVGIPDVGLHGDLMFVSDCTMGFITMKHHHLGE